METNCLNCNDTLMAAYCAHCGQKASTHRYSIAHFVKHDLIHGIWHVEKSALRTIAKLFSTPGHSVRNYLQGKRGTLFPFITMIVLILAISGYLYTYSNFKLLDLMHPAAKDAMSGFEKFTTQYPKLVMLILIPIYSIFSALWFRKARLNFSEHLVLNAYKTIAELLMGLAFTIFTVLSKNILLLLLVYTYFMIPFSLIYALVYYYQFFQAFGYKKAELIFRSIMVPLTYLGLSMAIGVIIGMAKAKGW